ncbi:MAG: chalcone isomerase family protein, partial [Desulfobacterales bacterium]
MMKKYVLALLTLLLVSPALAKEIGGANLPDTLKAGNEELLLNGAGLRTKFVVKVYAGGLYLKARNSDAQKIVAADEPMAIRMQFIHDGVDAKKLIEAWNEGFANATGGNPASIKPEIDKFNSFFAEEAK